MIDPEESAFIAAIRAEPEDDSPRLIFADWLEERGEGLRAEFIRVQIQLARSPKIIPAGTLFDATGKIFPSRGGGVPVHVLPHPVEDRSFKRYELVKREAELLALCGGSPWPGIGSVMLSWCRGFVEKIECTSEAWLKNADAIYVSQPVREVVWSGNQPVIVRGGGRNRGKSKLEGRKKWHSNEGMLLGNDDLDEMLTVACKYLCELEWPGIAFGMSRQHWPEDQRRTIVYTIECEHCRFADRAYIGGFPYGLTWTCTRCHQNTITGRDNLRPYVVPRGEPARV